MWLEKGIYLFHKVILHCIQLICGGDFAVMGLGLLWWCLFHCAVKYSLKNANWYNVIKLATPHKAWAISQQKFSTKNEKKGLNRQIVVMNRALCNCLMETTFSTLRPEHWLEGRGGLFWVIIFQHCTELGWLVVQAQELQKRFNLMFVRRQRVCVLNLFSCNFLHNLPTVPSVQQLIKFFTAFVFQGFPRDVVHLPFLDNHVIVFKRLQDTGASDDLLFGTFAVVVFRCFACFSFCTVILRRGYGCDALAIRSEG